MFFGFLLHLLVHTVIAWIHFAQLHHVVSRVPLVYVINISLRIQNRVMPQFVHFSQPTSLKCAIKLIKVWVFFSTC